MEICELLIAVYISYLRYYRVNWWHPLVSLHNLFLANTSLRIPTVLLLLTLLFHITKTEQNWYTPSVEVTFLEFFGVIQRSKCHRQVKCHEESASLSRGSASFSHVIHSHILKILITLLVATKIKAGSARKQASKSFVTCGIKIMYFPYVVHSQTNCSHTVFWRKKGRVPFFQTLCLIRWPPLAGL